MADPRQIEQELRDYLEKEPNIRKVDRLQYLMAIIEKHFSLDKIDHIVNHTDFEQVLSTAKASFPTAKMPFFISRKELTLNEANLILVLDAFIGYLNKNKLLKKLVKFDHRRE